MFIVNLTLAVLGLGNTKKKTSSTQQATQAFTFDPASMAAFQAFQPQIQDMLTKYAADPDKNAFFGQRLQQALEFNRALGQRDVSGIVQRNRALLPNAPSGVLSAQLARASRAASSRDAGIHGNLLLGFEGLRRDALNAMMGYRPLQTGGTQSGSSTSVETTSGLGTWLPQAIGGGIGLATAFAGGGGGFGSMFKGGSAASGGGMFSGGSAASGGGMFSGVTGNPFWQPSYNFPTYQPKSDFFFR